LGLAHIPFELFTECDGFRAVPAGLAWRKRSRHVARTTLSPGARAAPLGIATQLAMPRAQQKRDTCHAPVTPFCATAIANCVAFPGGDARPPAERVALPTCLDYTVQCPCQMVAFAPCPFSLSQLVDSRTALVWRNLSVSKRCTLLFPTSRLIRPSISRKSINEKQVARTNMSQSGTF